MVLVEVVERSRRGEVSSADRVVAVNPLAVVRRILRPVRQKLELSLKYEDLVVQGHKACTLALELQRKVVQSSHAIFSQVQTAAECWIDEDVVKMHSIEPVRPVCQFVHCGDECCMFFPYHRDTASM